MKKTGRCQNGTGRRQTVVRQKTGRNHAEEMQGSYSLDIEIPLTLWI